MKILKSLILSISILVLVFFTFGALITKHDKVSAKNVILMISDGAGFNTFEAGNYYQFGEREPELYENFDVKIASTHYMLNDDGKKQGYDVDQMWRDFNYVKGDDDHTAFTDSAAAATALYTGIKTYKGAVGVDFYENSMRSIAQFADKKGKATGVVTSVQLSHATPAAVFAHNVSRKNYADIANEMIYDSPADVIIGCGEDKDHGYSKYVGGEDTWNDINDSDGANGFTYVADVGDFKSLADGIYNDGDLPQKVLGVVHTKYTIGDEYLPDENDESYVPTLETMTKAALNVLSQDEDGFFLIIEGGAVDWHNHNNDTLEMVIEQKDFNNSVATVIAWIESNSGWEENLLIVTSDHETGMIWGPGTYTDIPGGEEGYYDDGIDEFNGWQNVVNNGMGNLPEVQYGSGDHTNALVPVFGKGCGCLNLMKQVDGIDSNAADLWNFNGHYIDNTDIFTVMKNAMN